MQSLAFCSITIYFHSILHQFHLNHPIRVPILSYLEKVHALSESLMDHSLLSRAFLSNELAHKTL
jgi:hypothetical protein